MTTSYIKKCGTFSLKRSHSLSDKVKKRVLVRSRRRHTVTGVVPSVQGHTPTGYWVGSRRWSKGWGKEDSVTGETIKQMTRDIGRSMVVPNGDAGNTYTQMTLHGTSEGWHLWLIRWPTLWTSTSPGPTTMLRPSTEICPQYFATPRGPHPLPLRSSSITLLFSSCLFRNFSFHNFLSEVSSGSTSVSFYIFL